MDFVKIAIFREFTWNFHIELKKIKNDTSISCVYGAIPEGPLTNSPCPMHERKKTGKGYVFCLLATDRAELQ
ncbi:MAG: hypothetical protein GY699_06280 [Desulfobacteraceae bacterium]|nr:hypothetical protein [Desulfobacteraceae bacterium]